MIKKICSQKNIISLLFLSLIAISINVICKADNLYLANILVPSMICILFIMALFYVFVVNYEKIPLPKIITNSNYLSNLSFICIVVAATMLRIILSLYSDGFSYDINCFVQWGSHCSTVGMSNFYTSGIWCDYPPLYIFILSILAKVATFFAVDFYSPAGLLIFSSAIILFEIVLCVLVYKLSKKVSNSFALVMASVVAFSPTLILNSSVWKQIDNILICFLVIAFLLLQNKKPILSCLVFALAVLLKPQALMLGPVYAIAFLAPIISNKKDTIKILLKTALCGIISLATIFVGTLPFKGTQNYLWLVEKLTTTFDNYAYASVNACNFYSMLGLNFKSIDDKFIFGSVNIFSNVMLVLIVVATVLFALFSQKKGTFNIFLLASFFSTAMFTFYQKMHERYSFLIIGFLLFAFITILDKRIFKVFVVQSFLSFVNIINVYYSYKNTSDIFIFSNSNSIKFFGLIQVALFIYTLYICLDIFTPLFENIKNSNSFNVIKLLNTNDTLHTSRKHFKLEKKDIIALALIPLVGVVISFANLGNTHSPQTTHNFSNNYSVPITFEQTSKAATAYMFCEVPAGTIYFHNPATATNFAEKTFAYTDSFTWSSITFDQPLTGEVVLFGDGPNINEIVFVDENNNVITPSFTEYGASLFDEQYMLPETFGFSSQMYFDEIYHARTAYEQLHGLPVYETTHPPFGKVLIEIGINLFGMTPFGWRFTGTFLGVLLIPLMYLLALKLFKNKNIALFCELLLLFDCMRFTQSRIATIDTPTVFFIMLSYLSMLCFIEKDIYKLKLSKWVTPLLLSGIFFGLSCATKWTGIYSGAGLCVIFFIKIFKDIDFKNRYNIKTFINIIGCAFAFFVFIPLIIYAFSYIPVYYNSETPLTFNMLIESQKTMFSYHSQLTATHSYSSAWWQWPLNLRPVWYAFIGGLPQGVSSTISLMGNPFSWALCLIATILLIVLKLKNNKCQIYSFILIGLAAQYIPWIFVSRATFMYHFFTCLPFFILALGAIFYKLSKAKINCTKYMVFTVVLTAIFFILFYPVISGCSVSTDYIKFLQWLPSWTFLG